MTRRTAIVYLAASSLLAVLIAAMTVRADFAMLVRAIAGDEPDRTILLHFRLPRVLLAALTGAALGLAGSPMQVMLRNPLASPDIMGFASGAAAGAVIAMALGGGGMASATGAVAGGVLAACLILGLAWRDGMPPLAFVLIGVGLSLMLATVTDILVGLSPAIQAADTVRFLTGSFSAATWGEVWAMAAVAVAGAAGLGWLTFSVDRLELGDGLARSLGLRPHGTRLAVAAMAAVLVSAAVAVAGPLGFVAFLAGPLARLAAGRSGTVLPLAASVGALTALCADALAQVPVFGTRLPAGVYTTLVGGPAMIVLLLRQGVGRS